MPPWVELQVLARCYQGTFSLWEGWNYFHSEPFITWEGIWGNIWNSIQTEGIVSQQLSYFFLRNVFIPFFPSSGNADFLFPAISLRRFIPS